MTSSVSDFEKALQLLDESHNDNLALKAQIEELKEQSKELGKDNDYLRNKIAGVQHDNSTYSNTQSRLETQLYAQEQDTADLRKQVQQLSKAKKDAEQKLHMELSNFESDRASWQQKEADMYNQIRTLNAAAGEPRTPRTPRRRSVTSSTLAPFGFPSPLTDIGEEGQQQQKRNSRLMVMNGIDIDSNNNNNNDDDDGIGNCNNDDIQQSTPKLATIDASYARESKIAQRTIKAQDKLILDLRAELEQHKSMVQDREAHAQRQSLRIQHLDQEISNVKQLNQSLMEDNESYQILLHEKTISGEFMMNPIMQVDNKNDSSDGSIQPLSNSSNANGSGLNLAAELNLVSDLEATEKSNQVNSNIQKLTDEVKTLQDTNRALQLYMNKILMKIIDNKQLEDVLSIDQPKPKPAPINTTSHHKESSPVIEAAPRSAGLGPAPTRTSSSSLLNKGQTARQQRRRTISYWGSKAPNQQPPAPNGNVNTTLSASTTNGSPNGSCDDNRTTSRRHSAMPSIKGNNNNNGSTNGGWAKALRRMSIGWSAAAATPSSPSASSLGDQQQQYQTTTPPASLHESTSTSSSSSDEFNSLDSSRISTTISRPPPCMSRSGSSTTSICASNELATLQEE